MRRVILHGLFTASAALAGLAGVRCTNETAGSGLTVGGATPTMEPALPGEPANTGDSTTTDPTVGGDNIGGVNLPASDTPDMTEDLDPEDSCAGDSASAAPAPAVLQFVVDTSGSMAEPPGDMITIDTPSKWETTRDALLVAMEQLGSTNAAGLSYFPGGSFGADGATCITDEVAVPIAVLGDAGSAQRDALATSLNQTRPEWATPTHAALRQGAETVQAYQGEGEKFVVLITDGRPTRDISCQEIDEDDPDADVVMQSQAIIDEAAAAAANGVRTFVIGSPGSEDAKEALSRIASLGGTPRAGCSDTGPEYCHFDMTAQADFAAALQQALSDIVGQVASCEFSIPTPPDGEVLDLSRVNVNIIDSAGVSQPVGKAPSGSGCAAGWDYSADMSRVVLCPSTCDAYKATPSASIAVEFGCVTVEIPE